VSTANTKVRNFIYSSTIHTFMADHPYISRFNKIMQSSQLGILRSNLTIKKCYTLQQ